VVFVFIAALLSAIPHALDAYTTGVGLKNGYPERNPFVAFIVKKFGLAYLYAIKCLFFPAVLAWLSWSLGYGIQTFTFVGWSVMGAVPAYLNFRKLREAK
jgi:hypothetical protein